MTEQAQTYHPALLKERRQAKNIQIFRRRLGVMAVMAAIVTPTALTGEGARPLAHDAIDTAKDRVAMIKDAFTGGSATPVTAEQARIESNIQQTIDQNNAHEASQTR